MGEICIADLISDKTRWCFASPFKNLRQFLLNNVSKFYKLTKKFYFIFVRSLFSLRSLSAYSIRLRLNFTLFLRNGYSCDLDSLSVGSRLGMMRSKEGGLHYTINGQDQGVAIDSVPPNVYAVSTENQFTVQVYRNQV